MRELFRISQTYTRQSPKYPLNSIMSLWYAEIFLILTYWVYADCSVYLIFFSCFFHIDWLVLLWFRNVSFIWTCIVRQQLYFFFFGGGVGGRGKEHRVPPVGTSWEAKRHAKFIFFNSKEGLFLKSQYILKLAQREQLVGHKLSLIPSSPKEKKN